MKLALGFAAGGLFVGYLWCRDERKRRALDEVVSDAAPGLVLSGGLKLLDVVCQNAEAVPVEVMLEAVDFRSVVNEHITSGD